MLFKMIKRACQQSFRIRRSSISSFSLSLSLSLHPPGSPGQTCTAGNSKGGMLGEGWRGLQTIEIAGGRAEGGRGEGERKIGKGVAVGTLLR